MREWFSVYKTARLNRRQNRQWLKLKRWWCTDIEQKNLQNVSQKVWKDTKPKVRENVTRWSDDGMPTLSPNRQNEMWKGTKPKDPGGEKVEWWWWICLVIKPKLPSLALSSPPSTQSTPSHKMASPKFGQIWCCKVAKQTIQWDFKFSMTPLLKPLLLLVFVVVQCER